MISFLATATITFTAIVVGYLSDSLPEENLNQLDCACLAKLSSIKWRPWAKEGPISAMLGRSIKSIVIVAGLGAFVDDYQTSDANGHMDSARERRRKGVERFILSLSDQQLVTGLAILIAGYINRCSMSFYHFKTVAALAWFSSTTHLATLTLLRTYLINHPRVRDWRVAAMLGIFALLALAQVLSYSTQDKSVPFHCAFGSLLPGGYDAFAIPSLVAVVFFLGTA